jgi:hypothetical protein
VLSGASGMGSSGWSWFFLRFSAIASILYRHD